MKLVSYRHNGSVRIGAVVGDQVVHLNGLLPAAEAIPDDMVEFLKHGDGAMDAARRAVARYEAERPASAASPLASCDLLSPVPRPGKILMGGRNYLRHLDELR
jgi:2-keto-4-pentenoate hydratase/2-oxohepta-3-ene-1,7-dioic acid hydratase in catechol pathway